MFKIYDGRERFYQWDVDRKLIVEDSTIVEVHFCNRTSDCSLVCDTYEQDGINLVNVPNILLQEDWDIHAYAYCGENYTKIEEVFEVVSRSRPADYVYTETETLNYNTLLNRIDEIDEAVSNMDIPSKLPNPNELTFTGAVNGTYDGTEPLTVNIPEGGSSVEVDTTLTAKGKAAESKAVGDALKKKFSTSGGTITGDVTLDKNKTLKLEYGSAIDGLYGHIVHPTGSTNYPGVCFGNDMTDVTFESYSRPTLTVGSKTDTIAVTSDIPDVSGYQTEEQVKALINAAFVDGEEVSY